MPGRVLIGGQWLPMADVQAILNHPGHADQKSHGRKGGGRGTASERVADAMDGFDPVKIRDNDAASAYLRENAPNLSASQADAVDRYTGDTFLELNGRMRSGDLGDPEIARLDSAMRPLPHDLVVKRTVGLEAFESMGATGADDLDGMVGKSFSDKAFLSTSLGDPYAGGLGGVTMHIATPRGTRGILAAEFSRNPSEREVILDRGLEIIITRVQPNARFGHDVYGVVVPREGA